MKIAIFCLLTFIFLQFVNASIWQHFTLQMSRKDSTRLFFSVCESLPEILTLKRPSALGLSLAEEETAASVGIPDNRGSVQRMCRLAFQICAYVMEIDHQGSITEPPGNQ